MPRTRQQPSVAGRQLLRRTSAYTGCIGLATGTYTGDGAATQAIVGVGFQPKFLIIYTQTSPFCLKALKSNQDGANTEMIEPVLGVPRHAYETDQIISLNVDGFTVGDGTGDIAAANLLNVNLQIYSYVAFQFCPSLKFYNNEYTGNGAVTQAIVGVGFQPTCVLIYSQAVVPLDAMKTDIDGLFASVWSGATYIYNIDQIISLNVDGFTVGDGTGSFSALNINGRKYSYMCWS